MVTTPDPGPDHVHPVKSHRERLIDGFLDWFGSKSRFFRWLVLWGSLFLLIELGAFIATAVISNDLARTLDLMTGTTSHPFVGGWGSIASVVLALYSWLTVPAVIGALVAFRVDRDVKPLTQKERDDQVRMIVEEMLQGSGR